MKALLPATEGPGQTTPCNMATKSFHASKDLPGPWPMPSTPPQPDGPSTTPKPWLSHNDRKYWTTHPSPAPAAPGHPLERLQARPQHASVVTGFSVRKASTSLCSQSPARAPASCARSERAILLSRVHGRFSNITTPRLNARGGKPEPRGRLCCQGAGRLRFSTRPLAGMDADGARAAHGSAAAGAQRHGSGQAAGRAFSLAGHAR